QKAGFEANDLNFVCAEFWFVSSRFGTTGNSLSCGFIFPIVFLFFCWHCWQPRLLQFLKFSLWSDCFRIFVLFVHHLKESPFTGYKNKTKTKILRKDAQRNVTPPEPGSER
ncbi:hypothetical protein ANANG_G00186590, partial [Anguilla anguilla]